MGWLNTLIWLTRLSTCKMWIQQSLLQPRSQEAHVRRFRYRARVQQHVRVNHQTQLGNGRTIGWPRESHKAKHEMSANRNKLLQEGTERISLGKSLGGFAHKDFLRLLASPAISKGIYHTINMIPNDLRSLTLRWMSPWAPNRVRWRFWASVHDRCQPWSESAFCSVSPAQRDRGWPATPGLFVAPAREGGRERYNCGVFCHRYVVVVGPQNSPTGRD